VLDRAADGAGDSGLADLRREVHDYPAVQALLGHAGRGESAGADVLVPCVLNLPTGRLSMFTALTTFGTPRDVTLEELCVELFYPADDATGQLLRAMHASTAA
jgi:hypothetical protein